MTVFPALTTSFGLALLAFVVVFAIVNWRRS